ncbi:penguin [Carabus blaptoides fortunei]
MYKQHPNAKYVGLHQKLNERLKSNFQKIRLQKKLKKQAKKIGENLRRKTLKGGVEERNKMTTELHNMLGGKGNYPKLVMTHDMARIVQYLLKFGSAEIRKDIAKELIPIMPDMFQSKYAKFCVKRMLKYGDTETRSNIVKAFYGNAVKYASHAVSSAIFDFAYTWASALQRQHLVQEFFGDMYKQSKEDGVKHLKDVYANSPDMKTAALGATKANLQRIVNKQLLDSHLVQTVVMQFMQECSAEDRAELISQLASHVVVLSNSKEGARAAMMCIWHGTNKDRKISLKALKEHVIALSKHEHGHCTIITLIDCADDTILVNKMLLSEIINQSLDLAADEWGRKVLFWLVAPAVQAHFHPTFVNEINQGREKSSCKKESDVRRKEILNHVHDPLLKKLSEDPDKWMASSSIALLTLAILKAGNSKELENTFKGIAQRIVDLKWTVKDGENDVFGIEHAGIHLMLKKLVQHDKTAKENDRPEFGAAVVEVLNDKIVKKWITLNRGCFIFVFIFECNSDDVQNKLKNLLNSHVKLIEKQNSTGAKLLLKKLN